MLLIPSSLAELSTSLIYSVSKGGVGDFYLTSIRRYSSSRGRKESEPNTEVKQCPFDRFIDLDNIQCKWFMGSCSLNIDIYCFS